MPPFTDKIMNIGIFCRSILKPILLQDFGSDGDGFNAPDTPYSFISHSNLTCPYPVYLSVVLNNTFIVKYSTDPIPNHQFRCFHNYFSYLYFEQGFISPFLVRHFLPNSGHSEHLETFCLLGALCSPPYRDGVPAIAIVIAASSAISFLLIACPP